MAMDHRTRYRYIGQINTSFTPGAPIDSRDLFAGREKQVDKVISTIFQKGSHPVLFGERGVGKTSLTNTIFDFLAFATENSYLRARLNCAEGMTFVEMWKSIFKQLVFSQPDGTTTTLDEALPENPNSENIRETFQLLDDPTIIIIDELDRVTDSNTRVMLADTIKTLSDNAIRTTLIMVGVADSVDQLIGEHESIERAIKQVPMPRMSKAELLQIVDNGLSKCPGLTIESGVRERLADYSQGLPFYTHLLSREAALHAVRSDRQNITMEDLHGAIAEAVDSQLETNLTLYNKAVTAPRGKYFKPVLLACALAQKDEKGYFYATNVTEPLRVITGKDFGIPNFAQHLKDFSESRGPIFERDGRRYRFAKPLMGPYVILRGLADGLIKESQLSHPPVTSTEPEQLSLLSSASVPPLEIEP
jgi:Cdc6-like AAA superfamily ATPase